MMKNFSILLITICSFQLLFSQASIDSSWLPKAGNEWVLVIIDNPGVFDEGPSGIDVTWDFQDYNLPSGQVVSLTWMDPANTPYYDEFPDATHAMQDNSFNAHFNYYIATENGLEYMGTKSEVIMDDPVTTHYTPYRPYIPYMNYFDEVEEAYSSYSESNNYMKEVKGYSYIFFDGYGSLLMPSDTFPDVIRLERIELFVDSTEIGNILIKEEEFTINYIWMEAGSAKPIAYMHDVIYSDSTFNNGVLIDHNRSFGSAFVYSIELATSTYEGHQSEDFMIYPNLAKDLINIGWKNFQPGSDFDVINMLGQSVHHACIEGDKTQVDISHLPAGRYFVKRENSLKTRSFIKVE